VAGVRKFVIICKKNPEVLDDAIYMITTMQSNLAFYLARNKAQTSVSTYGAL